MEGRKSLEVKCQEQENDSDDSSVKATPPMHLQRAHQMKLLAYRNSPSAFAAIRARQALLKSPVKYFDVPSEEQDIMTAEERLILAEAPKTIQDVMKDVVVYVEVRFGSDDRTEGIKKVISQLGATVNNTLIRNTTHVVFKGGRLSTYKKAKLLGIPIVSILWIEACRLQVRLCNTAKYQIANKEWYDSRVAKSKATSKKRLIADVTRRAKLLAAKTYDNQETESSRDGEFSDCLTPEQTEKPTEQVKKVTFNYDFEPDSPQLTKTLRILEEKKKKMMSGQSSSFADDSDQTNSNRILFADESNSFEGWPADDQQFRPLPMSFEPAQSNVIEEPAESVDIVSSDVVISVADTTLDSFIAIDKSPPKTGRNVISRKSMRAIAKRLTKYTPNGMDLSTSKSKTDQRKSGSRRSVGARKSAAMVLETPKKPYNCTAGSTTTPVPSTPTVVMDLTDRIDGATQSNKNHTLNDCFTAQTQILPETVARQSMRYVDEDIEATACEAQPTLSASIDITIGHPNNIVPLSTDLALDESSVFAAETQLLRETVAGKKRISRCRTIKSLQAMPEITTCHIDNTSAGPVKDTATGNRRRTLFTPNKCIELNRSNEMASRDQLLGNNTITSPRDTSKKRSRSSTRTANNPKIASKKQQSKPSPSNSSDSQPVATAASGSVQSPGVVSTATAAVNAINVVATKPLRRKLYAPPPHFDIPPTTEPNVRGINSETIKIAAEAKTQPLKDIVEVPSQTKARHPCADVLQKLLKNRRRTSMDFDTPPQPEATATATPKLKPTAAAIQYLVTTNIQRTQKELVQKVVDQLEGFQLDPQVTRRTTHLVTLNPQRTINMLRGIIRGIWILRYDWITESANANEWLYEEPFEVRNFSRAISMCRLERQLFGNAYQLPLFEYFEAMYISKCCRCPDLRELIVSCRGRVTSNKLRASYVISDRLKSSGMIGGGYDESNAENSRKIPCVHSSWILDSISLAKVRNVRPYLLMDDRPFVAPLVSFMTKF